MTPLIPFTARKYSNMVATIGFFGGVHLGHRCLIEQVINEARQCDMGAFIVTFSNHPRTVVKSGYQPKLLTTVPEKTELLRATGADACVILQFTPELAALTAKQFMEQILYREYGVKKIVVGYDHRFGSDKLSGLTHYQRIGRESGIEVLPAKKCVMGDFTVSSSFVRRLLEEGNVEQAEKCLGRSYELSGIVVEGHRVGRNIGFPTANLQPFSKEKLIPGCGVYAVEAMIDGRTYGAMLNIGRRPTLKNGENISVEAHIFDFNGNLYGESLSLRFRYRLRNERQFESLEKLQMQLGCDSLLARQLLSSV